MFLDHIDLNLNKPELDQKACRLASLTLLSDIQKPSESNSTTFIAGLELLK